MVCLSSTRIADIQARIDKKKAQLVIVNNTYDAALATDIESYKFDSGVGSQQAKRRKLDELAAQIDRLEKEIDNLERKLSGTGLVNLTLRR